MLARSVYVAAAVALVASLVGIRRGTEAVYHYPATLIGGIPAVVYEPGPPRGFGEPIPRDHRHPVVVLAHGFSGSKGMMGVLARRLARAGWAVVTFDFRGHGANRTRIEWGRQAEGLYDDVGAAVWYATTQPHFDAERLVLAGHSMGAGAVLGYASREPGASAVVAISGGFEPDGPYEVPNPLLIWAAGDPAPMRARMRELGARLAGLERLVADRVYGDPARGEAVRVSEVPGRDHVTILYSADAAGRILEWLRRTAGKDGEAGEGPRADGRILFALIAAASAFVLLFGIVGLLSHRLPTEEGRAERVRGPLLELLGAHGAALVVLVGLDPGSGHGGLGLVPVVGGGELASFFLLSGLFLWLALLLRGVSVPGVRPSGRALAVASAIALGGYAIFSAALSPLWDLRILPHRVPWVGEIAVLSLPFYLAAESRLRAPGVPRWTAPAGRVITFVVLAAGAAVGLLPYVILLALGALVGLFALFELVGLRLAQRSGDRLASAVVHALFTGWILGGLFPVSG